jgi:glycosidase
LWLTPFQENDEARASYHGYATTDHYKVDPRFGTNDLYNKLVLEAHQKGMKVIMDMVYNHVGDQHWFYKDPPMKDWVHVNDTFVQSNYRLTSLMDPHASLYDKTKMSNGWFVPSMPDLNQKNPFLAKYLIQNSIWWIESTGIDGFRIDTYAYSDLGFMNNLIRTIEREYPHFSTVGEVWDHAVSFQAYLTKGSHIMGAPSSHLGGVTDFQLNFALNDALNKPTTWNDGLAKIYYTLAQDFLYAQPERNLIFLDNHDLSRFFSVIGEDPRKFKIGIGFLMTMRGIPCMYYGTEILMKNFADPDGKVRADFPGGWKGDAVNKFVEAGRTPQENETFDYIKRLANYRKASTALQTGKLTQFVPEKDTYVYFRSDEKSTVMVIMYTGSKNSSLPLNRFSEMLASFTKGKDVVEGKEMDLGHSVQLEPYSIHIIQLQK